MKLTPLEPWILQKIDSEHERLSRAELEAFQLDRLRQTVHLAKQNSPFYRQHLAEFPDDLTKLADLSRLPFTTAEDIRRSGLQMLCVSQSEIQRVVTLQTSGTSGEPKRIFFTLQDQELTIDFFQHGMSTFTGPGDRVLILLPGEKPGSVGDLLAKGVDRLGAHAIPYGPVFDPLDAIHTLQFHRATCLAGAPTHVLALARFWERSAGLNLQRPHHVLLSTDYLPQAIIDAIEGTWKCKVFNHYGMTEMGLGGGVECQARHGYHVREADMYFEIVHPQTGERLPDGETGEVVFTTLTRNGMPLIRYRTGDLSCFLPDICPCGTILKSLEKIRYRIDGLMPVAGGVDQPFAHLGMADLDEVLFPINELLNFSAEIRQSEEMVELHITGLTLPDAKPGIAEQVRAALQSAPPIAFASQENLLQLTITIEIYKPGRMGGLAKRVIKDWRGVKT
jgi:phenylacetate-coenzyme A ligase PaaK-like adenylate-forming protein